jgi:hypothetical protein
VKKSSFALFALFALFASFVLNPNIAGVDIFGNNAKDAEDAKGERKFFRNSLVRFRFEARS